MSVTVAGTIDALKGGVAKLAGPAAIANIEGWEAKLKSVKGAEALCKDLHDLRHGLSAAKPDLAAAATLMGKIGKETVALAAHAAGDEATHLKELGHMLSKAGGH